MGFYNDVILPRLCDLVMRDRRYAPGAMRHTESGSSLLQKGGCWRSESDRA